MRLNLQKFSEMLKDTNEDDLFQQVIYLFQKIYHDEKMTGRDAEKLSTISEEAFERAHGELMYYITMEEWESEEDDENNNQNLIEHWYKLLNLSTALKQAAPEGGAGHELIFI